MKKIAILLPALLLLAAGTASAHVSVSPKEVGVAKFQTFTVSVPSEKDSATVGLRLVLPEGLENVSPTVKPGWTIRTVAAEAEAGAEEGLITEIVWTGGNIPGHFRDDFTFSARVPAQPTTLAWKAYQTYRDGTVVSWELGPDDEQPKTEDGASDFSQSGPYSTTQVIDDLAAVPQPTQQTQAAAKNTDALFLSMVAVALSVLSLYYAKRASR